MKRVEKETVVADISERLRKAKAVMIAEYRGLKVSEITEIRREVKKNSGAFKVVKNRLAKRAMAGSEWASLQEQMKGPLALIWSDADAVILSKILTKFAESFSALKIRAGILGGNLLDSKGIETLSKLPSREELYAKLLGTLLNPAQGIVRVLQGVPQKLAIALKAIAEKKQ